MSWDQLDAIPLTEIPERLQWLGETESLDGRSARATLLKRLAMSDPAAAMRFVQQMTDPDEQLESGLAVLSIWIDRDVQSALSWFQEQPPTPLQQQARDLFGSKLSHNHPEETFKWMEQTLSASARSEIYGAFFRGWAEQDPASAAAAASTLAAPETRADLLGQALARWSTLNPMAPVQWAARLPDGPGKEALLIQASYRWVENNPLEAAAFAYQNGLDQMFEAAIAKSAETDPQSAAAWLDRLTTGEPRDTAIVSLAAIWSQNSPLDAGNFAAKFSSGTAQDRAILAVVSAWVYSNPLQAGAWVVRFPGGPLRNEALAKLNPAWAANERAP